MTRWLDAHNRLLEAKAANQQAMYITAFDHCRKYALLVEAFDTLEARRELHGSNWKLDRAQARLRRDKETVLNEIWKDFRKAKP